jgi:hypothetical protein
MKRLLVVRIPYNVRCEQRQELADQTRAKLSDEFIVLVFSDKVEKTEVEIVYDPHFKIAE